MYIAADTVHTLDETDVDRLASLFKASGDPLRLEILRVLQHDTFGVLELAQIFETGQSGMSHHLKVLSRVGLVEPQREGNTIFYRRPVSHGDPARDDVIDKVFESVDVLALPQRLSTRIAEIRQQRAEQSRAFFARHAGAFRQQQELIADYDQYALPALELLQRHAFAAGATALEIGPGEGAFLGELAQRFSAVVALDNSAEMLDKARSAVANYGNVEFRLGDTGQHRQQTWQFDLVVLNMVLHHVPSPGEVMADCARWMKPGAVLLVSELSHHDQAWVKDTCGDLWLGFDAKELSGWAAKAGLDAGESLYIGLRNGFQIQVREFLRPNR